MPINRQVYDLVSLLSPYFARTGGAGTGGGAGLDWAPATTTAGVDKDGAEDNGGAGWTRMAGHTYLWAPLKITEILWDISVAGTYAMYISAGPSAVVQRAVVAAQVVAAPGTEVSFVPDDGVLCLDAGEYWLTVEISAGTCAWDVFHGDAENVLYYAFDSYMDAVVKPDWVAPFKLVAHIGTWLGTVAPGTTLAHGDLTGVLPDQHHAAVTLGGGSDPALALAGQVLTLANVLTPAEHTAIGDGAPHHVRGHTLDSETDHTDVENSAKTDGYVLVWRDLANKHGYEAQADSGYWEPLATGIEATPELIFGCGDVIMVEVTW